MEEAADGELRRRDFEGGELSAFLDRLPSNRRDQLQRAIVRLRLLVFDEDLCFERIAAVAFDPQLARSPRTSAVNVCAFAEPAYVEVDVVLALSLVAIFTGAVGARRDVAP